MGYYPDGLDLQHTHAHLTQGIRPSNKLTNIRDIKRYLNVATIAKDGLLIAKKEYLFVSAYETITVP